MLVKYNLCSTNCIHWKCTKRSVLTDVCNWEAVPPAHKAQGLFWLTAGFLQPTPHPKVPQLTLRSGALQPDHTTSHVPKEAYQLFPWNYFFLISLFSHYIPGEIKRTYFLVNWPSSFNNWKKLCTRNSIHNFKCAIGKPKQNQAYSAKSKVIYARNIQVKIPRRSVFKE